MNRFTYFDFIAYIVPGALLLGTMAIIFDVNNFPLITKNPAMDTLFFLIIINFAFSVTKKCFPTHEIKNIFSNILRISKELN